MLAEVGEINEVVDSPQEMIIGNMALKAEAVEQRLLHHRPLAHHRLASRLAWDD
jgi:hypothetical protein